MKYIKPINEIWGPVLKRDLLGETREEDRFHTKEQLIEYLKSEIEKQGENVVIRNLDVSLVEDLSGLFKDITDGVKALDLSGWKSSNIKDMSKMFYFCNSHESLDLSGWDTSNVKEMCSLFFDCISLKSLDLSVWKTSNLENMSWMFACCRNLETLNLSGWNTPKLKNADSVFYDCPAPYEVINNKIVKK